MNAFAIGDRVKILRIPEQVIQDRNKFPATYDLLEIAIGKSYFIHSFNDYKMAEIWMNDDSSEDMQGIHHSIWIEQEHIEKVSS